MKRYLVFCGSNYYPCGGMNDFAGSYDDLEEAKSVADGYDDEFGKIEDWGHVYDSFECKIIYKA